MYRLIMLSALLVLAGCGRNGDRVTIDLEEMRSSGISGSLTLVEDGEHRTRVEVDAVGGRIDGAWVATGRCGRTGDEVITSGPEGGTAPIALDELVAASSADPYAAVFLRGGRFVACGQL